MKMLQFTTLAVVLTGAICEAQIRAKQAGSAEALEDIQKQRDTLAAQTASPGELNVAGLAVGAMGEPTFIDAKVMQVIDEDQMLVGVEDARTGDGRYKTWVMVKCPTAGITDGKFWRGGQWKEIMRTTVLKVSGTTTYRTAAGGTKTVVVVEGATAEDIRAAAEKALAAAEARLYRKWTDTKGKFTGKAKFLKVADDNVHLQNEDGESIEIRLSHLSREDQKWVRDELVRLRREKERLAKQGRKPDADKQHDEKNPKPAAAAEEQVDEDQLRTWTIVKGNEQFKGRFEGMGTATLKDGTRIQEVMIRREGASRAIGVAPERLIEEDQEWVRQALKRRGEKKSGQNEKPRSDG